MFGDDPEKTHNVVQVLATRASQCLQAVEDAADRLRRTLQVGKHWHLDCARRWDVRRDSTERNPTEPLHGWQRVVWPLLTARASIGQVSKWTVRYSFIKIGMKLSLFIKNHFHQKPLSSSKTTFIQNPLSSKNIFIKNHHQKPLSSKTTFIQNPLSSKTIFSTNPKTLN